MFLRILKDLYVIWIFYNVMYFCFIIINLPEPSFRALTKQIHFIQHKIIQRGKVVIVHSHSEIQPNNTFWFSTYWFRVSDPFRSLTGSALTHSDVTKQPLTSLQTISCSAKHSRSFTPSTPVVNITFSKNNTRSMTPFM
ncbi:hypothetical protein Hanom_Chr00s041709g01774601 [Helianthus anomalus]